MKREFNPQTTLYIVEYVNPIGEECDAIFLNLQEAERYATMVVEYCIAKKSTITTTKGIELGRYNRNI